MKKISENVIIRQQNNKLEIIQTGPDFTYKESFNTDSLVEAYACVDSTKFAALFEENVSKLTFEADYLSIVTRRTKGLLPYMKEFGIFNAEKELEFDEQVNDLFEADYSNIDLDLTDATDQFSYVLFNRGFACRYLYNTFTFYGDMPENWLNITPKQFKLLKSLGKCNIEVSENMLKATSGTTVLILRLYTRVINLAIIKRYFEAQEIISFNLNSIDFKKLKIFLKDTDIFNIKRSENDLIFSSLNYFEDFEMEDISSNAPINLNIFKKDLENLIGNIKVYCVSGINYLITKPEENKTILFTCER